MLAAIFDSRKGAPGKWLSIEETERPSLEPGYVLIKIPCMRRLPNRPAHRVTRGEGHRKSAERKGATWVGDEYAKPPIELDRAITFAPSGKVVVTALSALR